MHAAVMQSVLAVVGSAMLMYDEPLDTVLLGMLDDNYLVDQQALAVDSINLYLVCAPAWLVAVWDAREAAPAARGAAVVSKLELVS